MHDKPSQEPTERARRLLAAADLCVKCGLCLPTCPTYAKTRNESESPRGRIALIQGLANGQLSSDGGAVTLLSHCLSCRACERVCPSGVRFGGLMDGARSLFVRPAPRLPVARLLRWLATDFVPHRVMPQRVLGGMLRLWSGSILARAVGRGLLGRRLARLAGYVPATPLAVRGWREYYPPTGAERGQVALFLGCVARVLDRKALDAAITVLNALGYGVRVPVGQGCCGALDLHAGDRARALRLVRRNLAAFSARRVQAVITCASGCGATLAEYPLCEGLSAAELEQARRLSASVRDVSAFVTDCDWPADLRPLPSKARVMVHEPCSLRNVMGQQGAAAAALRRIPDMQVTPLSLEAACCGSAGSYMLEYPEMADALGDDQIARFDGAGAEILATSNIGCALHLAARLRARGRNAEVVHPLVLLARQLSEKGNGDRGPGVGE